MKKVLAVMVILTLIFSAVSFTAFAEETDLAESAAGYIPPHPYYSSGEIKGTTGGGTKADPIIVDTFEELRKALEFPIDGLYIRCDTCVNNHPSGDISPSTQHASGFSYSSIEVRYDKNLTLNANLDCRSSSVEQPFLDALISVMAYLKVDGSGSIAGTFSALSATRNAVFSVYAPGVLELSGVSVMGAQRENGMTYPAYARAVYVNSGTAVFNSGSYKGVGYKSDNSTWGDAPESAVIVQSGAHAIVNGGTFQCTNAAKNFGISMGKTADVILAGGTFYGIMSDEKVLSTFLKSNFAYKRVSGGATYNASSVKQTMETLRVDYTGSGLRPTQSLTTKQIPMSVGYEYLHFTPPDDNTWYNSPLLYSIDGGDHDEVGSACYLDFAGSEAQAYDLYDSYDQLMKQFSYCSFSSDYKPIRVSFYLTADENRIFSASSYIYINGKRADLQILGGKRAIASVTLTYTDSDLVVDNIALKGSFSPAAGLSANSFNGKLDQSVNCDDGKCEVTNSWIGESGRFDDRYTGTLVAGNTYYMWFEVKVYHPNIYGVDLTYSFYDSTGKSNPSSYNKNYGSLMGEGGSVRVSVPFIVPAQNAGCMIRGTVTSYLSSSDTVTVQLLQGTTVKKSATVTGNTASYSITNVPAGTYTLRVTKKNHVDRDYTVVINGDKTQNVTINPLGDVNLNGVVDIKDVNALYKHVMETKKITDPYALKCGDVSKDYNTVDIKDVNALYKHVMETKVLY